MAEEEKKVEMAEFEVISSKPVEAQEEVALPYEESDLEPEPIEDEFSDFEDEDEEEEEF